MRSLAPPVKTRCFGTTLRNESQVSRQPAGWADFPQAAAKNQPGHERNLLHQNGSRSGD